MHRFVQLTSSQVDKYVENHGLIRGGGCCYFDMGKQQYMYEYHVDACDDFLGDITSKMEYGGNLSFKFAKSKLTLDEHSAYMKNGAVPKNIGFQVDGHVYVDANMCSEEF